MNQTEKLSSLACPFPLIVFHDSLVQLFGSPVEEIGTAVIFPTMDIHIGVVALTGLQLHGEESGEMDHQFLDTGFSAVDTFQGVEPVQLFHYVGYAACPTYRRGIRRRGAGFLAGKHVGGRQRMVFPGKEP